ncbi:3-oxoacyl-[acyl-carrier-protein] reductase FabG [bacterium HR24]|jgi:3-oxoacyl-[acyl-carrier protein] reductase|nr:3-oxoacyl-[acyl-carrier-protein] reductase FabG [bacterium HR24]
MDLGLGGRAAIVGGASKGIGRAIALGLAREGCRVALAARGRQALDEAARAIAEETGVQVLAVPCDMARYDDIRRLVAEAVAAFGRLDIVVANAGGPPAGLFEELGEEAWQRAIDQNLLSAVRLVREALPHLKRSGSGRIVAITSAAVKQPRDYLVLSNTARLGVVGLAKTLSRELAAYNITVNTVCPGNIATERLMFLLEERARRTGRTLEQVVSEEESRIPLGYLGEAEDVANLVLFLCSDKARYITGTTIQVDGGSTVSVF